MDGEIVILEAHLHPMATAWPLGADNTTDSLSDDAGSQISVIWVVVSNVSGPCPHRLLSLNGVVVLNPLQLRPRWSKTPSHLVAAIASSDRAQPTTASIVSLGVPLLGTSIQWFLQWPLGAENRTDSPFRNRGSQFSVLTSQNIVTTHLATAIASSVSRCAPDTVILS